MPDEPPPDVISSHDDGRLDEIARRVLVRIRRPAWTRTRRFAWAAGGIALAGLIAAAVVLTSAPGPPPYPGGPTGVPAPAVIPVTGTSAGGVFARGVVDHRQWWLALQNIADPGYPCLPAVAIDGTDADLVYPASSPLSPVGDVSFVSLGSRAPGSGFGFVQVPSDVSGLVVGEGGAPRALWPVTMTACGRRFRLAGFAYAVTGTLRLTAYLAGPRRISYTVPAFFTTPAATEATPRVAGVWENMDPSSDEAASATIATGHADGGHWSILLTFGAAGDCYGISAVGGYGGGDMSACGPVSTPDGAETIMALPLGFAESGSGVTGYALSVSPGTARLVATLSDGPAERVTPVVVKGRKYAAFLVPSGCTLIQLTWLDRAGHVIGTATSLPSYGYTQYRP
jgi:hypothetical protein